jgi:hypothetical protein
MRLAASSSAGIRIVVPALIQMSTFSPDHGAKNLPTDVSAWAVSPAVIGRPV